MKFDPKVLHQELNFRTSRASGSGGQHVNKVETRVELLFDIPTSHILTEEQKSLLLKRCSARINKEGTLIIANQESRSQARNKENTIEKFDDLLRQAFAPRKKRKKVKPPVANKKKRLEAKKRRSEKKAARGKVRRPEGW